MSSQAAMFHRPSQTGRTYWGPGDAYTFLVTGDETDGAYFAMEAIVPQGGGPPPHIHTREDETFYVLEGECTFRLGDETITAGPGDFVNVPRGQVHNFFNERPDLLRMIVTFTPAGLEKFFEETLERAYDLAQEPPADIEKIGARYAAAAPRYGLEFVLESPAADKTLVGAQA
jgi:quercetin dioxygenase-like cupin family protein